TGTVLILFRSNVDVGEMLAALNELVEIIEADLSRERGQKKPAPKRPRNISLPGEPSQRSWHSSSTAKVLSHLRSSERGLSKPIAKSRLQQYGPNILPGNKRRTPLSIFAGQFGSLPVALLAGSAVLSVVTGGLADAAVIMSV